MWCPSFYVPAAVILKFVLTVSTQRFLIFQGFKKQKGTELLPVDFL